MGPSRETPRPSPARQICPPTSPWICGCARFCNRPACLRQRRGAVIALARGDKMVCRATMGDKAPSAGVCLNTRSGLSGACVQTREMQLCDDTLADPRVNVVACRDLGIRSIVVLPVLDGGELWGVLEVFSSVPRAFSDSDSAGVAIAQPQDLEHGERSDRGRIHGAGAGGIFPAAGEIPRNLKTLDARSLDRPGSAGCGHRSAGLPHRRADGGGSGSGCAAGLDGGPRGLEYGGQSGADPDSSDSG